MVWCFSCAISHNLDQSFLLSIKFLWRNLGINRIKIQIYFKYIHWGELSDGFENEIVKILADLFRPRWVVLWPRDPAIDECQQAFFLNTLSTFTMKNKMFVLFFYLNYRFLLFRPGVLWNLSERKYQCESRVWAPSRHHLRQDVWEPRLRPHHR